MPADSTGSVFLWVNRDAENFKSRDHKRVSKSYVQRAKHLKDSETQRAPVIRFEDILPLELSC